MRCSRARGYINRSLTSRARIYWRASPPPPARARVTLSRCDDKKARAGSFFFLAFFAQTTIFDNRSRQLSRERAGWIVSDETGSPASRTPGVDARKLALRSVSTNVGERTREPTSGTRAFRPFHPRPEITAVLSLSVFVSVV